MEVGQVNTEMMIDKISLFHLAIVGTGAGVFNWLSDNNIGFWISMVTGVLILLLTIRKAIATIISDYKKWREGTLFNDGSPDHKKRSENGKYL